MPTNRTRIKRAVRSRATGGHTSDDVHDSPHVPYQLSTGLRRHKCERPEHVKFFRIAFARLPSAM